MGFDNRYRGERSLDDEFFDELASDFAVTVELARSLFEAARREASLDDYRRTPRQWFAMLVRRRAEREPVPGKRTAIQAALEGRRRSPDADLAPGRRMRTDAEARRRDDFLSWGANWHLRLWNGDRCVGEVALSASDTASSIVGRMPTE
jgi:hypothetical protein